MKIITVNLESLSPYGQNKFVNVPKLNKELSEDYEKRTWRERAHYDPVTRECFIPCSSLKNCVAESAKYSNQQIPGKGKSTWTKHFEAGIMVTDNIPLGVTIDNVKEHQQHVPADGKRGGTKRVMKSFPCFEKWSGTVDYYIIDDLITLEVFEHHIIQAGSLIGLGWFRPRNNGYWGRFKVNSVKLKENI